ncbi:hypothetical protein TGP89_310170 [Toxoplasma gondii p89]|uniref:Uncharacterized protein n=1 Tax=Toxoplasma gondii p89 TaxID=943119 RepID=A0A086K8T0_TOXGO|nr:hypothetical protein TGP89_310170 [Toxoplasma gondii p89]
MFRSAPFAPVSRGPVPDTAFGKPPEDKVEKSSVAPAPPSTWKDMLPTFEAVLPQWGTPSKPARVPSDRGADPFCFSPKASGHRLSSAVPAESLGPSPQREEQDTVPTYAGSSRLLGVSPDSMSPAEGSSAFDPRLGKCDLAGLPDFSSLRSSTDSRVLERLLTTASDFFHLPKRCLSPPRSRFLEHRSCDTQRASGTPLDTGRCASDACNCALSTVSRGSADDSDSPWEAAWSSDRQAVYASSSCPPRRDRARSTRRSEFVSGGQRRAETEEALGSHGSDDLARPGASDELAEDAWERSVQRILGEAASALRRYSVEGRDTRGTVPLGRGQPRVSPAPLADENELLPLRAFSQTATGKLVLDQRPETGPERGRLERAAGGSTREGRACAAVSPFEDVDASLCHPCRPRDGPAECAATREAAECLERLRERDSEKAARLSLALMLSRSPLRATNSRSPAEHLDSDEERRGRDDAAVVEKRPRVELPATMRSSMGEAALGEQDWQASRGLTSERRKAYLDAEERRVRALLSEVAGRVEGKRRREEDSGLAACGCVGEPDGDGDLRLGCRMHARTFDRLCLEQSLRPGLSADRLSPCRRNSSLGNGLPSLSFAGRADPSLVPCPRGRCLDDGLRQRSPLGESVSSSLFLTSRDRQDLRDRPGPLGKLKETSEQTRRADLGASDTGFFVSKSGRSSGSSTNHDTEGDEGEFHRRALAQVAYSMRSEDLESEGDEQKLDLETRDDGTLPDCWTVGQKDHFTEKYKWLFLSGGMLGCLYCRAMKDRGLRARKRGMKIVSHWADGAVKPSGASRVTNMRSLRKKICRHQDSRTHKEAAELLGEAPLKDASGLSQRPVEAKGAARRLGRSGVTAPGGDKDTEELASDDDSDDEAGDKDEDGETNRVPGRDLAGADHGGPSDQGDGSVVLNAKKAEKLEKSTPEDTRSETDDTSGGTTEEQRVEDREEEAPLPRDIGKGSKAGAEEES